MDKKQSALADAQQNLLELLNEDADGIKLTGSQEAAYRRLEFLSDTKFAGMHKLAGIATRPMPLIVGASGSGKTALVREYARRTDLPIFAVSVTSWIVFGAKCEEYTLTALKNFVEKHGRGVIFLDELNKLRATHTEASTWSMTVLTEIMGILDSDDRLLQCGFTPDQVKTLKESFFIVGAGAWQEEWCASKGVATMGFGGSPGGEAPDPQVFLDSVKRANVIPQELLFRFNERIILIEPPDESEIAERIAAIRSANLRGSGTCKASDEQVVKLAKEAAESECPMRWLEAFVGTTLEGHSVEKIAQAAAARRDKLKRHVPKVAYTKLYNSTLAIVRRLAYESSQSARDLSWWLRSEKGFPGTPLSRFVEEFAQVASQFTLPTLTDTARRALFEDLCDKTAHAPVGFREFMGLADIIRPGTYDSARKFLVLAEQLATEVKVVRQVMLNPDSLANENIKDHEDDRVHWFKGQKA